MSATLNPAQRKMLFEMMSRESSFSYRLANRAYTHHTEKLDEEAYLEKLRLNLPAYVDIAIESAKR